MKRLLALLLTLLLALPSGFALAEGAPAETKDESDILADTGLSLDSLTELVNSLLDATQEMTSEKAGEIKDNVSEKADEIKNEASDKADEIKNEASDKIGEITDNVSDKIDEIMEDVSKTAEDSLGGLPEKVQDVVDQVLESLDKGKEKASELISNTIDALPGAWETVKETVGEKASEAKDFVQDKVNQLLNLIKGNEPKENDPKSDGNPEEAVQDQASSRICYFDLFYFGMSVSEAKALGLGDPAVDAENGVQYWGVTYDEPQGFAVILFNGLDDSAKLTEIVCVLYSDADTVTELEEGVDIQTTEETVNAMYDEIESWFTGLQALELGDHLALPLYSGFSEEEETISRAVLYLYEDGEGYNAATHYVSTTDCGVNMLQYLYLDAAEAEALLAK